MIKVVLLAVLALVAGVAFGLYYKGVPFTSLLTIPQPLQSAFTQIQTAWTSLPDTVKAIIMTGIPTAFVTFFAWTKSRAMQKLEQVKQQATMQLGQLEGEKLMATQGNAALQQTNIQLQEQLSSLQQANQNVAKVQEALTKANTKIQTLQDQKTELQRMLTVLIPKEEKPPVH